MDYGDSKQTKEAVSLERCAAWARKTNSKYTCHICGRYKGILVCNHDGTKSLPKGAA